MKTYLRSVPLLALGMSLLACQVAPGLVPASSQVQAQASANIWSRVMSNDYEQVFAEHDSNRNGTIELAEIPYAPRSFNQLDRDHNGKLSKQEALPDSKHLQYLTDYMLRYFKAPAPTRSSEDPQLQPLPSPAEFERVRNELTQSARLAPGLGQLNAKAPILLVPGYAEPSWYFMYGLYKDLKQAGWQVEGINLFPNFASAEEQAAKVKLRVEEMKKRLGVDKVNLVVHSFGGLISRYYIQELGGLQSVERLITIATPHHGTYAAYLGPGASADQMQPGSEFLKKLNANGFAYPPIKYTSIWTNLDEIVVPPKNSIMPDSNVRYVPWTGHLTVMFSQRTYRFVREALNE